MRRIYCETSFFGLEETEGSFHCQKLQAPLYRANDVVRGEKMFAGVFAKLAPIYYSDFLWPPKVYIT